MRMKRFITGAVAAGLLGLAPTALAAAPAQALTPAQSAITGQISKAKAQYGDSFYISGNVQTSAGYPVGTVKLERRLATESSYRVLKTDTTPGYFSFDLKAAGNAYYRISYSGGSDATYSYAPTTEMTTQKVARKLGDKIRKTTLSGKVSPTYKKKKVVIEIKKGGKWRKYTTVKTTSTGKWVKKLPASRKKTYWRAYTPADKLFVKSYSNYSYWTVRY